ncbi:hypothetical protein DFJ73DRAFT_548152 [Zopfochytrium polystomum]|nr:hypothetical protein DFJ73DRAFT_548152 [Zopfochytrium polystomum]
MPSFNLLQRGVLYFTVKGTTLLPLLKHGMDVYYYKEYQADSGLGPACQRVIFPLVCWDDIGSSWTIYSEVGCESVAALLAAIIIAFHTLVALAFLVMAACAPPKEAFMYLVALEDGCCGAAAVVMSIGAFDVEVEVQRKGSNKWRRAVRFITAGIQFAIVVVLCAAINVVTGPSVLKPQRTSLFVLLPALFLNIYSLLENAFEGSRVMFE